MRDGAFRLRYRQIWRASLARIGRCYDRRGTPPPNAIHRARRHFSWRPSRRQPPCSRAGICAADAARCAPPIAEPGGEDQGACQWRAEAVRDETRNVEAVGAHDAARRREAAACGAASRCGRSIGAAAADRHLDAAAHVAARLARTYAHLRRGVGKAQARIARRSAAVAQFRDRVPDALSLESWPLKTTSPGPRDKTRARAIGICAKTHS